MKKRLLKTLLLAGATACSLSPVLAEDKSKPAANAEPAAKVTPAAEAEGVRSIALPALPFDLPEAPGKNLVVANCIICHSPSYITMQPAFPRKVWEAEVAKMRTTFGAGRTMRRRA